jgi:hypothetical protein
MEILISGILGIIIWQSVTLFAFAASNENEDVGLYMGMGLPLILVQLIVAAVKKIKWEFFRRKHKFYIFMDATLGEYNQARKGIFAKPKDMQCFNFDATADYYVIEKECAKRARYLNSDDVLTPHQIQYGLPGMSTNYLNKFKKN